MAIDLSKVAATMLGLGASVQRSGKNWLEMKTVFRRNILIRTNDLLVLFDISIRYD